MTNTVTGKVLPKTNVNTQPNERASALAYAPAKKGCKTNKIQLGLKLDMLRIGEYLQDENEMEHVFHCLCHLDMLETTYPLPEKVTKTNSQPILAQHIYQMGLRLQNGTIVKVLGHPSLIHDYIPYWVLEWSPHRTTINNDTYEAKALLEYLCGSSLGTLWNDTGRITRLDIANDVEARFEDYDWLCAYSRKITLYAPSVDANGTRYFGSPKSKYYIRIYDKRQERLQKGCSGEVTDQPLLRVEVVTRQGVLPVELGEIKNPFTRLTPYHRPTVYKLLADEPDLVASIKSDGLQVGLKTLKPYQRRKRIKQLAQAIPNWWQPEKDWVKWPEVITSILLGTCGSTTPPSKF